MGKTFADRNEMISTLRKQALNDSDMMANKSMRHGLFTSSPPLSIGDTAYDIKKIP